MRVADALAARTKQNETDIEVLTALRLYGSGGGGSSYTPQVFVLSADQSTAADTNPISLSGMTWNFVANATYIFRFVGNVNPTTATTGCGFQLLVT